MCYEHHSTTSQGTQTEARSTSHRSPPSHLLRANLTEAKMFVIYNWLEARMNFRRKFIGKLFRSAPRPSAVRMVANDYYIDDSMLENLLSRAILNAFHDQSIYHKKTMWVSE